ncbi:MAG: hypothetical protein NC191_08375 [Muribaculaceae bacterium]|nr:hypothetical protein [Muribaculaceae bacterium]
MNNSYYETLDENFIQALNLYEREYSHEELLCFLQEGNIVQRQIAALRLVGVYSTSDAEILLSNLTGQDGKIREAVSLKLCEFMADSETLEYFKTQTCYDTFLDAIIDINPNICRNVISAITNLRDENSFVENFCPRLVKLIFGLLDEVENIDFREKKYKTNKAVFKLYWCLETVYEFFDKIRFEDLKQIILRSKAINEYTIREKSAKILSRGFEDEELTCAKTELQADENYYVRRY